MIVSQVTSVCFLLSFRQKSPSQKLKVNTGFSTNNNNNFRKTIKKDIYLLSLDNNINNIHYTISTVYWGGSVG